MKIQFIYILIFCFSLSLNAQIDSQKKSIPIPAIESKKDTSNSNILFPSNPKPDNSFGGLNSPKANSEFSLPKKEFSMFGETFGNPGELFEKKLTKTIKEIKEEMYLGSKGSTTDQYFGDFTTKAKYVYVMYSDYGEQDGDYINISVNDEIINPRIMLTNANQGFKLDLKEGFNKIDFLALTEGYLTPNTAFFKVVDDQQNTITSNYWALAVNVKATIIIVKE
jgi:hypothetical protein